MSLACIAAPVVRRAAAAAAAGILALSLGACSSGSGSGGPVTDIKVGSSPGLSGIGLRVAVSEGAFAERGLTVTPTANKSANDTVPQLLSGALQVAQMDTITLMQARSQGLPIRVIAGAGVQSTDGEDGELSAASVVSAPSSPIKSPRDLVGKKVGVPAIKTQTWMNIRAIVDRAGGDSAAIEFVEVPPAQTIDLVQQGFVDAATPNEPLASSAVASGKAQLVHNTDVPGNKGVPSSVYVATEQFITQNPEAVKKFTEGIYEAAELVNGNAELAGKVAREQLGFSPEQLENAFVQTFAEEPVTAEQLDKIATLAVEYEVLTDKPVADELLAESE